MISKTDRIARANVLMEAADYIEQRVTGDSAPYGALVDLYQRASVDYYEAGQHANALKARQAMIAAQDNFRNHN